MRSRNEEMMAVLVMEESNGGDRDHLKKQQQQKKKSFHDFLGMSVGSDSVEVLGSRPAGESAPGRRISAASDLGSERQMGLQLEGVPFYGRRSDLSGPDVINRTAGSKRSNSDPAYMESSKNGIPQCAQDGFDRSHLMKSGGEPPRRPSDEEMFYSSKAPRPTSTSQGLQHLNHNKTDGYSAKWDRAVPMNVPHNAQYASHVLPFMHPVNPNTFRDASVGPSVISHMAADEGSRTGIKGSGILNSMKSGLEPDNNSYLKSGRHVAEPSGVFQTGSRSKSGGHISELEAAMSGDRRSGSSSARRRMTIFYGGQAHVFDDVPPNKAYDIMAVAGSNGGSWSTTVSTKSSGRQVKDGSTAIGEAETGTASNMAMARDHRGKSSSTSASIQELRPVAGVVYQGSKDVANHAPGKDTERNPAARERQ